MDYSKIYIELMERSFTRTVDGYTEKHHIIPRCCGGDDKERNLAILTPEEHYLAHQLLVKIYPKNHKLVYAATAMCMSKNGKRINNKVFGWLKRKINVKGEEHHNFGKKKSDESRNRLSASLRAHYSNLSDEEKQQLHGLSGKNHPNYGRTVTDEIRQKIRDAITGTKYSPERIEQRRIMSSGENNGMYGKTHSVEARERISSAQKQVIKKTGAESPNAKEVHQYSINGEYIQTFGCSKLAAERMNVTVSAISRCCIGKSATSAGYVWRLNKEELMN